MQPFRSARHFAPAILTGGLLLSACQKPPAPVAEAPPPLPPHLGPPPAALCSVAPFTLADGGVTAIAMTISSDGGYCAVPVTRGSGQAFDAPLVPAKPLHGDETVVRYNHKTSVEYAARAGFTGHDSFTVKLIVKGQPGYTTLNVGVDVQPAGAAARTS